VAAHCLSFAEGLQAAELRDRAKNLLGGLTCILDRLSQSNMRNVAVGTNQNRGPSVVTNSVE